MSVKLPNAGPDAAETRLQSAETGSDQPCCRHLGDSARSHDVKRALDELEELWSDSHGRSWRPWTREELHDRRDP